MVEHIAITGTRQWPSEAAQRLIEQVLLSFPPDAELITGGCVGVDEYVAAAWSHRNRRVHTVLPADHKLVDPRWRKHCTSFEQMPKSTDYRARNARLVALGERVVGFPDWPEAHGRSRRSGTWMTIRLAHAVGKYVEWYCLRAEDSDGLHPMLARSLGR